MKVHSLLKKLHLKTQIIKYTQISLIVNECNEFDRKIDAKPNWSTLPMNDGYIYPLSWKSVELLNCIIAICAISVLNNIKIPTSLLNLVHILVNRIESESSSCIVFESKNSLSAYFQTKLCQVEYQLLIKFLWAVYPVDEQEKQRWMKNSFEAGIEYIRLTLRSRKKRIRKARPIFD